MGPQQSTVMSYNPCCHWGGGTLIMNKHIHSLPSTATPTAAPASSRHRGEGILLFPCVGGNLNNNKFNYFIHWLPSTATPSAAPASSRHWGESVFLFPGISGNLNYNKFNYFIHSLPSTATPTAAPASSQHRGESIFLFPGVGGNLNNNKFNYFKENSPRLLICTFSYLRSPDGFFDYLSCFPQKIAPFVYSP